MKVSPGSAASPELVIFDCDGVLVDSEPIVARVLTEWMRDLGLRITYEECAREFVGLAQEVAARRIADRLDGEVPTGWFDGLTAAVDAALRAQVRPVPGVAQLLERLRVPFCVASNGRPAKVDLTLSASGLARYFDGRIFTASQVSRGKPAPDLFLLAASRMGVQPERCVVVEDSEAGVAAGLAAGMRVLRYAPDGSRTGSTEVFHRMDGLPPLLGLVTGG